MMTGSLGVCDCSTLSYMASPMTGVLCGDTGSGEGEGEGDARVARMERRGRRVEEVEEAEEGREDRDGREEMEVRGGNGAAGRKAGAWGCIMRVEEEKGA